MVYGEDPRQGYFINNQFYHPELKFQFPKPGGWNAVNTPVQVQMASKDGKAMLIFTLAQEKDLNSAINGLIQKHQLKTVSKKNTTVNGMRAMTLLADQISQDQASGQTSTLRILTYAIEYNGLNLLIPRLSCIEGFSRVCFYNGEFYEKLQQAY